MDFKKVCEYYINNRDSSVNPNSMLLEVRRSYKLLQSKRQKLKTGAVTFAFKQFYYGDVLISQWFELEFKAQIAPQDTGLKSTLKTLDLTWDFQTLLLLLTILVVSLNYFTITLEDYYFDLIACG